MYIQIFEDQYRILEKFPNDIKGKAYSTILKYAFEWIEPKIEDDPIVFALFDGMKYSLDKSIRIAKTAIENGNKWWRPEVTWNNAKKPRTKNKELGTKNEEQKQNKNGINNTQTGVWVMMWGFNYSEEFEKFRENYPKKKCKTKAYTAWNRKVESWYDCELIIQKAHDYAREVKLKQIEERFIKRPELRLNWNLFEDDYFTWVKKQEIIIQESKPMTEKEKQQALSILQNAKAKLMKKTFTF